MTDRFIGLNCEDEIYYLTDTTELERTLKDFEKDYRTQEYQESFTIDELKQMAKDDYAQYLYEHSMTGTETVDTLNELDTKCQQLEKEKETIETECQNLFDAMGYSLEARQKQIKKLKKENKHIKSTIQWMLENERTELGKNVLKQLQEVINND